jgi:glutamate synthase (NADPH/NADH) small chain
MDQSINRDRAFLDIPRKDPGYRSVEERVKDFLPVEQRLTDEELKGQSARCMDCGTPFCHGYACPLGALVPEFNQHVSHGRWAEALSVLLSASPFPEFTARICPALCEGSCVCGIGDGKAVTVRQIELEIIERGFAAGLVKPRPPAARSGFRVSVIGSGPAGLAAADALNRAGCTVTVYEQAPRPGGILRYGIPDFKLAKTVVDRRISLMEEEGVVFECGVETGRDVSVRYLLDRSDAIVLACGSREPRDLKVPGRELGGIHFAMDYLSRQNRLNAGDPVEGPALTAAGKDVVVIGGGDTGSDCVGTAIRQGAKTVLQIEIMPQPPACRAPGNPWPQWPAIARESSSHREGCVRRWCVTTQAFLGEHGQVKSLRAAEVEWRVATAGARPQPVEKPGSEFTVGAELVLLALGFTGPARNGLLEQFQAAVDPRGALVREAGGAVPGRPGLYAVGDLALGPSLVVRAMADGKKVAGQIVRDFNAAGCKEA